MGGSDYSNAPQGDVHYPFAEMRQQYPTNPPPPYVNTQKPEQETFAGASAPPAHDEPRAPATSATFEEGWRQICNGFQQVRTAAKSWVQERAGMHHRRFGMRRGCPARQDAADAAGATPASPHHQGPHMTLRLRDPANPSSADTAPQDAAPCPGFFFANECRNIRLDERQRLIAKILAGVVGVWLFFGAGLFKILGLILTCKAITGLTPWAVAALNEPIPCTDRCSKRRLWLIVPVLMLCGCKGAFACVLLVSLGLWLKRALCHEQFRREMWPLISAKAIPAMAITTVVVLMFC